MKLSSLKPAIVLAGILSFVFFSNLQGQDLNAAIMLTRSEQYDNAAEIFKKLIQAEPGNSKNYFFYGENMLADYFSDTISNSITVATRDAKEQYQKGVNVNANEPLNYIGLAKVAFYLDDNKTADDMRAKAKSFLLPYKNIKKIVPPAKDYAFTLAKIAESYITVDNKVDTALALPLIRQALTIDSKSKDIYLIIGDIYNLKNDGSNAIKNYNLAQDYDPKSPTANMKIGSIYVRGRNLQEAIRYFEQAIALNVNYAPAYRELGQVYSLAQRYDKSKEYFNKYLELTKGNIPAMISYVKALFYSKQYDDVITNVEEIFKKDKSRTYLNRLAAYSEFEKKNPDYNKALQYMETLFKVLPSDMLNKKDYLYLAKILLKKNQDHPKMVKEAESLQGQLGKEKERYATATGPAKVKLKTNIDTLTLKISKLEKQIAQADVEIYRAYDAYAKALLMSPEDKAILSELALNNYNYLDYEMAAKTWEKMIPLGKNDINDYMQIARAYYQAEKFTKADSIYNLVIKKSPDYLQAYVWIARTYSKMDPSTKAGLAKPKFEMVIEKARIDTIKNSSDIMEAYGYLGYYYTLNDNYSKSREYYLKMLSLDPNNKANVISGYNGLGQLDYKMAGNAKTIEEKLPYLAKAQESFNKIIGLDPNNVSAKNMAKNVQDYEKQVRAGINPNEIKGIVKSAAGQPIASASIRVKDTAAETLTNAKGEYKFEIPQASEALLISAKGYKTQEVTITKSRIYNIVLEQ
jgi:tetratricopeptide (TPR) repeat protein